VFHYAVGAHNVAGYKSCTPGAGARTHTSGNDRITLRRGRNFICSFPGHCAAGMNITVDAH
jgi:azurin